MLLMLMLMMKMMIMIYIIYVCTYICIYYGNGYVYIHVCILHDFVYATTMAWDWVFHAMQGVSYQQYEIEAYTIPVALLPDTPPMVLTCETSE